ncbi:MAG: YhcH/YjgK/YiaL family protein [Sphingobacteriales bacterium]|nr:YhcH/YjgK/YiaL family protein [Sphingobacteriales bacterium]
MIIDTIQNAGKYYSVHPLFEKAFSYIRQTDLERKEAGHYEIESEQLRAIIADKKGMTREESVAEFECHNQHIDIQLCIRGTEQIGWKPREKCVVENGTYNAEKDVQFVIFFPEDVHAPMIGEDEIKKLVIKVKI